jgi:hypothetical protein
MKLQFSLDIYHWLGQQENKTFRQDLYVMNLVDVMKTVNQIFWIDPRVAALKIQAKFYLKAREELGWRMMKKIVL